MVDSEGIAKLVGFSLTLHREGTTEDELLCATKMMEKSLQIHPVTFGFTTFKYHLVNEENRASVVKGLHCLKKNIASTMVFCPQLKKVTISDHGKVIIYERGEQQILEENIFRIEILIQVNGVLRQSRYFVFTPYEQINELLPSKSGESRKLRLNVSIEVTQDFSLLPKPQGSLSYFIDFPMIGTEEHVLPIYLNSPDFEPTPERDFLLLRVPPLIEKDDKRLKKEKKQLRLAEVNKTIFLESIHLFQEIVSFLSRDSKDLFYFADGLKNLPPANPYLDQDWYKDVFLSSYRKILEKAPIIETVVGRSCFSSQEDASHVFLSFQ